MDSTHNEGKSVVAERIFKKNYKYMTSVSEWLHAYIDKLDDIAN